jgi:GNAT superfamily N-acetyltransferase
VNQIRPPRQNELALLQRIEHDASQRFAEIGLGVIAAHEPASIAELERCIGVGRAWVAVTDRDRPVGYLLAATIDDCAHVVQVSVARAHASRRLGATLIDHLATVAGQAGQPALTLTTFRDVAWNAPYYRRLRFEVLAPDAQGPELARLVAHEATSIPGHEPRVAMRRWLTRCRHD